MSRPHRGGFAPPDRPIRRTWTPVVTVLLASALAAFIPAVASLPLLPPPGLMLLVAWRLLQPELMRPWAPVPLGLFDDLVSGAPLGSAMLLWTLSFLVLDVIDRRLLWRDFWQDWLVGSAVVAAVAAAAAWIAWTGPLPLPWPLVGLQALVALLAMPLVLRVTLRLDSWRQS